MIATSCDNRDWVHQSQVEYRLNTKIQLRLRMWVRMETKRMKEPNKFPTFLWHSNPCPWYWKTKRRLRCHPVCRNLNVCCFLTVGKKNFPLFFFLLELLKKTFLFGRPWLSTFFRELSKILLQRCQRPFQLSESELKPGFIANLQDFVQLNTVLEMQEVACCVLHWLKILIWHVKHNFFICVHKTPSYDR